MPAALRAQLECEIPEKVRVGRGTALFICGWCYCPSATIRELRFRVGGELQPMMAQRMPRLGPFQALHPRLDPFAIPAGTTDAESVEDPLLHSYRSGFWGVVRIGAGRAGEQLELSLCAELEGGGEAVAELARITTVASPPPASVQWPADSAPRRVAICMATYNPPLDLLERQLESIRAQTHRHWVCFISDDCSSIASFKAIERAVAGDSRFVVSRSPRRLGFYRNFERCLSMVPHDADYVAMADQDDAWHPDKLATLLSEIGSAQLVYSDAHVVSRNGELLSETWWRQRRNNHSDLLSLLVANAVTGAASLMRRDLLDDALPFPPAQFAHFHDHWVGLVALARGDIEFVGRPLYDYVQHGQASLGHAAANQMTSLRKRLLNQRGPRERVRMWRLHYFVDVCRLMQFATVLQMRCGDRMTRVKRRLLARFMASERSLPALLRLALRGALEFIGTPETLGAEWALFHAFAWRRLLDLTARDLPQRRLRLDALPPPTLVQQPGRTGLDESAAAISDKIAPLHWRLAEDAPTRVNLLIPTIDLRHFFGGYIAKLNLAQRLVDRGFRVRVVTVDPVAPLPPDWRRTLEAYSGLHSLFKRIEVVFGRESPTIEVSAADSFIASTWWTAHIARHALESVASERFVYLIQEYEPFTFPMGTYTALATESYRFPHFALFSSELLRGYFRSHGIGVYAAGSEVGDRESSSFQNAITPVQPPTVGELAGRQQQRLLFYARPEPHAARNMFELGVLGLVRALEDGIFSSGWELHGIGTVERGRRISLGGGAALELLPRADQSAYAKMLRQHDVGLALMYTPHPSLVPIEMASAGMLTVTNSFENKTPRALADISSNLITAEPTIEGVAAALAEAASGVANLERRIDGSRVRWSNNWSDSLDEPLLDLLADVLRSGDVAAVR
jgi:glycosyltransferase involved in cell wall biosynthesis